MLPFGPDLKVYLKALGGLLGFFLLGDHLQGQAPVVKHGWNQIAPVGTCETSFGIREEWNLSTVMVAEVADLTLAISEPGWA